jgi:hypothetical protein
MEKLKKLKKQLRKSNVFLMLRLYKSRNYIFSKIVIRFYHLLINQFTDKKLKILIKKNINNLRYLVFKII